MKEALTPPSAVEPARARAVLGRFATRRRTLFAGLAIALVVLAAVRARDGADGGSLESSLGLVLARGGLVLDETSVAWLADDGGLLEARPAVFRAREREGAYDVWYAEVRPGRGGAALDVSWVTNLTRTSSADEGRPVRSGPFVAYVSQVSDGFDAISVLDTSGEPESLTRGWSRRLRAQNAITNLQETGRAGGIGRRRYRLAEPISDLSLTAARGRFVATGGGARIVLDPARDTPLEGQGLVELTPMAKGAPGTITWVVDTVRNVSFIGPEPIEWLEHRVFAAKDAVERAWYSLAGDEGDTEAEVASDLGVSEAERRRRLELSATDPELGWPPAPMEIVIDGGPDGEGQWIAVVDDPFVRTYPGAPPAFYQSFIRADPERPYARVYVTIWDPRLVQLHIVSGTREPESATGETGTGMAPRDEQTLGRLVAGFNGGFQALHGEFGMMEERRVYLPPKPWAATVAVFEDGRVGVGSWTAPPEGVRRYEEGWAVAQIPAEMVALRQNLTSVVEDGRFNPWERWWWGAAPVNADEQTIVDRTGVCLTEEGFLAYFWGESMLPEALGRAMLSARCARGMHLDMNSQHTGFELYNVARRDPGFPALGRRLDPEFEFEGPMPLADGFVLRARKMIRRMTPMRFPRYVGRDPRDFFYLTLRPTLPGPPVGRGIELSTAGLPHAGFPPAFARAATEGDAGARSWIVRIDPTRAVPEPLARGPSMRPLGYLAGAKPLAVGAAAYALYAERTSIGHRFAVGPPPEGAQVIVSGEPIEREPDAGAAIGVDDEGFLLYVERESGDDTPLARTLATAGAPRAIALPDGVRLAFALAGDTVAPDAFERPLDPELALPLLANERPYAEVLFPDTTPIPYHRWWRMQDARVRYVREGPPTFTREGGGLRTIDGGVGTAGGP